MNINGLHAVMQMRWCGVWQRGCWLRYKNSPCARRWDTTSWPLWCYPDSRQCLVHSGTKKATNYPLWNVDNVTQAMAKGGGGGACESLWNVDHDVTQAMSKGGGACECPRVGVFFKFWEGGWHHAGNVQGGGVLVVICVKFRANQPLCPP